MRGIENIVLVDKIRVQRAYERGEFQVEIGNYFRDNLTV